MKSFNLTTMDTTAARQHLKRAALLFAGSGATASVAAAENTAAESAATVGLVNVGVGMVFFTIAGALLLTLVFRASAAHVVKLLTAYLGEQRIRRLLNQNGRDAIHDFMLPGAFGGLTHIDHALLTKGGIICIQTKHCNGTVFGKPNEAQWTNIDGALRQKFLNPMIQNDGRAKALEKVVPGVPIRNLVVFTGSVSFTSKLDRNVIHINQLNSYIARFKFGPCQIKDWSAVSLSVKSAALTDDDSRKDFRAQLNLS